MNKKLLCLVGCVLLLAGCSSNNTSFSAATSSAQASSIASSSVQASSSVASSEETVSSQEDSSVESSEASSIEEISSSVESSEVESSIEESSSSEESSSEKTYTITTTGEYTDADGVLTLNTTEGKYTLSGTYNGNIIIPEGVTKVTITLDNATIHSESKKAIEYVTEDSKLVLKLADGTNNTIYSGAKTGVDSANNIELAGNGALTMEASKHGFSCSNFTVTGDNPNVTIEATSNGINAKQINLAYGEFNFTGCDTAIDAELNSKGSKGSVEISGTTKVEISNCTNGVVAEASFALKDTTSLKMTNVTTPITSPSITICDTATCTVDGNTYNV